MQKKAYAAIAIFIIVLGIIGAFHTLQPIQATPLEMEILCGGTVDKKSGESFIVKIAFKNKGTSIGMWKIAVTFEGEHWTWKGEEKTITLKASEEKTITWEGNVPENAAIDSIARLIVYYNDRFVPLKWWIHVVAGAQLHIVDSIVV